MDAPHILTSPMQAVAAHGHSVVSDHESPVVVGYSGGAAIIGPSDGIVHLTIPTPTNLVDGSSLVDTKLDIEAISGASVAYVAIFFGRDEVFKQDNPPLGDPIPIFPSKPYGHGTSLGATLKVHVPPTEPHPPPELRITGVSLTFSVFAPSKQ
ncbi:hypothetical protein DL769_007958 [Monosporascus sp. CRB-8-3]|nr:hypothetical protein DL769_007958 [Monosporascus sp. CRB-8-3]